MMNKWFDKGLKYEAFITTDTEEIKEKAMKRRTTIIISTEIKEEIEALKPAKVLVFTSLSCRDSMIVLPYLEKINEINPEVDYSILTKEGNEEALKELIGRIDIKAPTLLSFTKEGEPIGQFEEYPEKFKKRLKGLDQEDTEELKVRYRRGYYNTEVLQGILELIHY